MEKATFGAGCFWGVEATFRALPGVIDAAVGYMGGVDGPTSYKEVCTGKTGHAEIVEIRFDPTKISYAQLLDTFWNCHNPTQLNRQGPDVGTQYRSAIFYHSPEQQRTAEKSKAERDASGIYKQPIVTVIEPAGTFHRAEEYHQRYFEKNGGGYCHI